MADYPAIIETSEWQNALEAYRTTFAQLEAEPQRWDDLSPHLVMRQEELLRLRAPHLMALLQKLYILWEADLCPPGAEAFEKRRIIEDLRGIIRSAAVASECGSILGGGRLNQIVAPAHVIGNLS